MRRHPVKPGLTSPKEITVNMTYVTENDMIVFLAMEARNPDAIANGTNRFALEAILEVGPGFEWSNGTQSWRVA